jgi:hypothetical protein
MTINFSPGTRFKDPLYLKLRSVHNSLKNRCYNPKSFGYKWYGGKGVKVCPEWQSINGFIETVDLIEGWDEKRFLLGELELDKDSKYKGNKIYSPENCRFINKKENAQYKPSYQRTMVGLSPLDKTYKFSNQTQFAKQHELLPSGIRDCLTGRAKSYKGWFFTYEGSGLTVQEIKRGVPIFQAISPDGVPFSFTNKSRFAREHGLQRKQIERAIKNAKSYKGWKFYE